MKTPRQVAQAWLDAYNTRSAHALIDLYHEDAVNHQVAFGEPMQGREELLKGFLEFFHAFPDNYTHAENILVDGDWVIIEWLGGGTFSGLLGSQKPTAKVLRCAVAAFFKSKTAEFAFNVVI
ncbi:MAG TPA: ester cyclase [Abditibacteriaceae bacterium]|jgi:hypothetical protein